MLHRNETCNRIKFARDTSRKRSHRHLSEIFSALQGRNGPPHRNSGQQPVSSARTTIEDQGPAARRSARAQLRLQSFYGVPVLLLSTEQSVDDSLKSSRYSSAELSFDRKQAPCLIIYTAVAALVRRQKRAVGTRLISPGSCSGGKFDVYRAGGAYDARGRGRNRKFVLDFLEGLPEITRRVSRPCQC